MLFFFNLIFQIKFCFFKRWLNHIHNQNPSLSKDISESSLSRITACLCESDLCNVFRAPEEKRPDLLPVRKLPQTDPLPLDSQGGNKLVQVRGGLPL
jgi:hypothetical protein